MTKGVSVVVCCHNSVERLPATLRYLAKQKTHAGLGWEVIVVDNASSDETERAALEHWKNLDTSIRLAVVKEPRPGLSYARTTGVKFSSFDVIVFCDDDNWLSETYVQSAFEVMQLDQRIGAAGGRGIAVADEKLPDWFEEYEGYFACYRQGKQTGELREPSAFLYGAGLVLRKKAVEYLHSLDIELLTSDRIGKKLLSGGDNELCYLLRLAGYKLWYDERLEFYHYMPKQRLSRGYLIRLINGVAYSSMKLVLYHYALTGKKARNVNWIVDILYRLYFLVRAIMLTPFITDNFKRKSEVSASWNALKAVFHLYGKYPSIYKSLKAVSPWS